ncbi:MAG: DUF4912 domain-containing protein [Treponema sp.]|jgi:hypothetical protein|nr:DUF4912 domain-containing protein [Treponema sp.]
MKSTELSRTYLEGLTTEELIVLADRFDIEVPPDLTWNFIVETLLEINAGDGTDDSDNVKHLNDSTALTQVDQAAQQKAAEENILDYAVPLPEQYNISFVDVLIRDPLWIYVFWEISGHEKEMFENKSNFNRYYLKICPTEDSQKVFTVHIRPIDTAWYVGIPDSGCSYKVELCVSVNKKETVIASSGIFTMPALFEPVKKYGSHSNGASVTNNVDFNPLQILSGVDDFTILHKRERIAQ